MRYEFGENWSKFVDETLNEDKVRKAKQHMLSFLGVSSLNGKTFVDIGCGSGIHSLAAFLAGAESIVSFDYDPQSVATTKKLHKEVGEPEQWKILQGSVLDNQFLATLGTFDYVYSWGVLHHTGQMWKAVRNSATLLASKGIFSIALYCTEVFVDPDPEYWLGIKKKYNRAGRLRRRLMELNYALHATFRPSLSYNYLLLRSKIGYRLRIRFILRPILTGVIFLLRFLASDKVKSRNWSATEITEKLSFRREQLAEDYSHQNKYKNPFEEIFSTKNRDRGMDYWTDVRDWLGGYPMEFAGLHETREFCENEMKLSVLNVRAGEACTEYTFCFESDLDDCLGYRSYSNVTPITEKPSQSGTNGWKIRIPEAIRSRLSSEEKRKVMLLESGKAIGWEVAPSAKTTVEELGLGRHAIVDDYLFYSSTDNSSILDNNRVYSIGIISHPDFD